MSTIFDGDDRPPRDISHVSLEGLLDFLSSTHVYYLECRLPAIRRELMALWEGPESDLSRALINYFDDLVDEITKHTVKEERILFPYVRMLAAGKPANTLLRDMSPSHHHPIKARLTELKRILIKYSPARDTNRMNDVLFAIYNWEHDLTSHIRVEEMLLAPIIKNLELHHQS
jgi:regulator of cell morphogenesis and NO signaling